MRRLFLLLKSCSGQTITETALIFPFLLVLIGGIVDFGLLFFVGQVIENASREAVRAGAVIPPEVGETTFPASEEGNCTFPGGCSGSGSTVLEVAAASIPNAGLFDSFTIESECVEDGDPNEDGVRVTITGTYNWFLLKVISFVSGSSTFSGPTTITRSAIMRWEWQPPAGGASCGGGGP
jgi:hypothetical protein